MVIILLFLFITQLINSVMMLTLLISYHLLIHQLVQLLTCLIIKLPFVIIRFTHISITISFHSINLYKLTISLLSSTRYALLTHFIINNLFLPKIINKCLLISMISPVLINVIYFGNMSYSYNSLILNPFNATNKTSSYSLNFNISLPP